MNERALEVKVGALILVAVGIMVALVLVLGNVSFAKTWELNADFGFSGGVHAGAPVKVSGIDLGRVEKVTFLGAEVRDDRGRPVLVRLTLAMDERAREVVRTDSEFFVNTQGVLGQPYVEIVAGDLEGEILKPGTIVRGVDPPRTDLLLARVFDLLDTLGETLGDNKELITELVKSGSGLTRTLDEVLTENRGAIQTGLDNVVKATDDLVKITSNVKTRAEPGGDVDEMVKSAREAFRTLRDDLPPILEDLRVASAEAKRVAEATEKFSAEDIDRAKRSLVELEKIAGRVDDVTVSVEKIVNRIERGHGTVGALLQDDQIYDDLKELLRDLKEHPWKVVWKE